MSLRKKIARAAELKAEKELRQVTREKVKRAQRLRRAASVAIQKRR